MMWRSLFTRMVALAMQDWERCRNRQPSPSTPVAAVRATIAVSMASMPAGFCLLKAASEANLNASLPGSPVIQQTRDQMYRCPAVHELARGAGLHNAIVAANVVSGANGENQYLLAVVPITWLASTSLQHRGRSV